MFKGSNVALITPFKDNELDIDAYIKLIHYHLKMAQMDLFQPELQESPQL